jgi:HSP20 family molecular chaperone IbpA
MTSFLDRLKKKKVVPGNLDDDKKAKVEAQVQASTPASDANAPAAEQLKVDIFQTDKAIVIYAQIAGASVEDCNVTIEGEGDVVTIKGERTRPNGEHFKKISIDNKDHLLEECSWGKFYRQVILPNEVDAAKTQAKVREGVLMLLLPLKETKDKGLRINVVKV